MSYDVSKQFLWPGCRIRPLFYLRLRSECDDGTFSFISPRTRHNFVQGGNNLEIAIQNVIETKASLTNAQTMYSKYMDWNVFSIIELASNYCQQIWNCLQQIWCRAVPVICIKWCILVDLERILMHLQNWELLPSLPACLCLPWSESSSASVSPKFLGEAAVGFAAIKTSPLATKCLRRHKMRQSGNILCPGTPQSSGTPK